MRTSRVLAVLACAALAGCIDPALVPCGDLSCPADSTCVAGACVAPEQLSACAGLADSTPCVAFGASGYCVSDVCQISRCGNGVLDPGEVCDDGNQQNGDGCRGDCLSTGECGNGIVDPGESCDCGDSAAPLPDGCPTHNDDDPTALCDTTCSRHCGDGVVTGAESCDGTNVPVTCADLGYYSGDVSCTRFCTLDKSSCTGRCGDGIVQLTEGEVCDGSPPNITCVSVGRDYGVLGCNSLCSPDLQNSCHQFNWQLLLTAISNGSIVAANANHHGVMAIEAGNLYIQFDGADHQLASDATRVLATPDALVAIGPSATHRYDANGATSLPSLGTIVDAASDGGSIYTVDSACTLNRLEVETGVVVSVSASPLSSCAHLDVLGGRIALTSSDRIAWYDGATWQVHTGIAPTGRVAWRDATHVYYADATGIELVDLTSAVAPSSLGLGPLIATSALGAEMDRGLEDSAPTLKATVGGQRSYAFFPNTDDLIGIARDGDGDLMGWGYTGVYLALAQWLPDYTASAQFLTAEADGSITYCDFSHVVSLQLGTATSHAFSDCTGIAGSPAGAHLVSSSAGIYHYDQPSTSYILDRAGSMSLRSSGSDVWAFNNAAVIHLSGGVWVTTTTPVCYWHDLALNGANIYLTGQCGGFSQVYKWDGATWQVASTTSGAIMDRLVVADDGTVFGCGDAVMRLDGMTQTLIWQTPAQAVAARSHDDAYFSDNEYVYHWDGTTATPFNDSGAPPAQLAVFPDQLVGATSFEIELLAHFTAAPPAGL